LKMCGSGCEGSSIPDSRHRKRLVDFNDCIACDAVFDFV
jgi:hypothetical protein